MSDANMINEAPRNFDTASNGSDASNKDSFGAIAGTFLQLAGFWSMVLGVEVYSDTDYLKGLKVRAVFFACCAVLVVGGFSHWKVRSLHPAWRVITILLVLAAAAIAAFGVIDASLVVIWIVLVIVAIAYRFVASVYVIVAIALALTAFSAFRAIDDIVIRGWGLAESFVSVIAVVLDSTAVYFAIRIARRATAVKPTISSKQKASNEGNADTAR